MKRRRLRFKKIQRCSDCPYSYTRGLIAYAFGCSLEKKRRIFDIGRTPIWCPLKEHLSDLRACYYPVSRGQSFVGVV